MRELEARQAAEEAQLLSATSNSSHSPTSQSPSDSGHSLARQNSNRLTPSFNLAPSASAPTTPPRSPSQLSSPDGDVNTEHARQAYERMSRSDFLTRPNPDHNQPASSQWMGQYTATAPTSPIAQFGAPGSGSVRDRQQHLNKAKSQPVSRRHSGENLHGDSSADGTSLVNGFDKLQINGNK